MAEPSREEMMARLEATEARAETRLTGIEAKIDRFSDQVDAKIDRLLDKVGNAIEASNRAEGAAHDAKNAAITTRWNILFMVLGGLAALIGIVALGYAVFDTAAGIFQAGGGR